MKNSGYAKKILDLVESSHEHLSAEQIHERIQSESCRPVLATVYNNLNHLTEQNLIRRIAVEGQPDRYDRMTRHDHLICTVCGSLQDVFLGDLSESLKEQTGEEITGYDLRISWICPACRTKK